MITNQPVSTDPAAVPGESARLKPGRSLVRLQQVPPCLRSSTDQSCRLLRGACGFDSRRGLQASRPPCSVRRASAAHEPGEARHRARETRTGSGTVSEVLVLNAGYEPMLKVSVQHAVKMPRTCEVEGCARPAQNGGLCWGHRSQRRRGQPFAPLTERRKVLPGATCSAAGCGNRPRARGLCQAHYRQQRLGIALHPLKPVRRYAHCTFEGCERPVHGQGLCSSHHAQRADGKSLTPLGPSRGERPIGATRVERNGYVKEKVGSHPNAKNGWILQHVLVVSRALGRPLEPGENVHHVNGVRSDNRLENLELWTTSQPTGQRVSDKVEWALRLLETYAPELLASNVHEEVAA